MLAGLIIVEAGILRGLRDTTSAMWIIALGYWGAGLGTAFFLGFVLSLGAVGIWVGMTLGFLFSAVRLQVRFSSLLKGLDGVIEDLTARDSMITAARRL